MPKSIILKNDTFQKLPDIRLEFAYDFELKETVKGNKDRIVRFRDMLHGQFNAYLKSYNPKTYLLEDGDGGIYSEKSLAEVVHKAVEKAGIKKAVTPHWFPNTYATHLHEAGTDIRYIQELLGHQSSSTTAIYMHVSNREIKEIRSRIKDLDFEI